MSLGYLRGLAGYFDGGSADRHATINHKPGVLQQSVLDWARPDASYPNWERNWAGGTIPGFPAESRWSAGGQGIRGLRGLRGTITPTLVKQAAGVLQELQGRLAALDPRTRIVGVNYNNTPITFSGPNNLIASFDAYSAQKYRDAWGMVVRYLNDHPLQDGTKPDPQYPPDVAPAGEAARWLSNVIAIATATAAADASGSLPPANTAAAIAAGTPSSFFSVRNIGILAAVVVAKKLILG